MAVNQATLTGLMGFQNEADKLHSPVRRRQLLNLGGRPAKEARARDRFAPGSATRSPCSSTCAASCAAQSRTLLSLQVRRRDDTPMRTTTTTTTSALAVAAAAPRTCVDLYRNIGEPLCRSD
uniref:Uncharacterized protein n=1 Tax=Plectus sambesii TaxID=2011161 RepID=A0A914XRI4_9BILA